MRTIIFLFFSFVYLYANAHIFVYHRFGDERYPTANTTKAELIEQFEYLKTHNYKVVKLQDILDRLKQKKDVPSNWVAFTIDDGYKSFYEHGYEIFKKYNYPFSLFIYVKATNKHYGDFMSWKQIKQVSDLGTIGLHSYAHPRLQMLTTKQIIQDTKKAINIFQKHLGYKPKVYVYPYGEYDNRVKNILKDNFDFEAILNQNTGTVTKDTDIYDIPRIALVGKANIKHKLKYKSFNVKWQEPKEFPPDGVLHYVKAKVNKKYKKLKLYITSFGWIDVKVNDGIVNAKLDLYLKKARTRLILGPDIYTISNKIINKTKIKESNDVK